MTEFEIVYEIPPLRAIYRTVIKAESTRDAEDKIRTNPKISRYRIKEINEIK